MQRIDLSSDGKFGSFVPKPVRKKRIEDQNISESKSFRNCIGQMENNEGTLNKIIQRLITVELRKHRDKEQISIKRTYSDSKTVVHNDTRRQPINFNPLMSNLERSKQRNSFLQKSRSEKTKKLPNNAEKNATFQDETEEEFLRNVEPDKAKEVEILQAETEAPVNLESMDPLLRELKLDSHNTQIPTGDIKDFFLTNKICKKKIENQEDASTQTEHHYLVQITQSCPVQKKYLASYVNLNLNQSIHTKKIPKHSPMKDLPVTNLNPVIHRKASDNLIYEKHKGCASPSYIPSPERFRWKYISPTNSRKDL